LRVVHRFRLVTFALCLVALVMPSAAPAKDDGRTKIAASGGEGGEAFTDETLPKGAHVIGVKIRHGAFIDAIELLYKTADKKEKGLGTHGGDGGEEETFLLKEGEYITGLAGKTGDYVESLTILTNMRKSKRFGGEGGDKSYELKSPGAEVVGFYGRSGDYLDQIGIFVKKK